MTEKCFDEGTIQAFLDGELESDLLESVARHTASCEVCAFMLQEAEEESSFAFSALGEEFNSLVPTERIRTSLYDAIAQIEKPRTSIWTRLFGGFNLANPSILAFASLLLVFGISTTLYIVRENQNSNKEIAIQTPVSSKKADTLVNTPIVNEVAKTDSSEVENLKSVRPTYKSAVENQPTIQKANYRIERANFEDQRAKVNVIREPIDNRQPAKSEMLAGEESYVKTIATLSDNVNSRKDSALRPSERVAFEKDLAVVDDAIAKMQKEVRKNPKNEAARQVLRSSYQNKIDLLNSVAEKTELMASLR
jgi:hypothetical protein